MNINIEDLTFGQLKQIAAIFNASQAIQPAASNDGLNTMLGKHVIVRTYSAGVWFGILEQKSGKEVIIKNARRMWKWWAAEGISLSSCAIHGINRKESKIVEAVDSVWLEAVELIPCTDTSIKSIGEAENVKAQ